MHLSGKTAQSPNHLTSIHLLAQTQMRTDNDWNSIDTIPLYICRLMDYPRNHRRQLGRISHPTTVAAQVAQMYEKARLNSWDSCTTST